MEQQLKLKYPNFENIMLLFNSFKQTINWLSVNFKEYKQIKETLIITDENQLERIHQNHLKKFCCARQNFHAFNEIIENNQFNEKEKVEKVFTNTE